MTPTGLSRNCTRVAWGRVHYRSTIIITSMQVIWTGVYLHMLIAVTASGGQFVTWAARLPGQFVAPGWRSSNALSIFHILALAANPWDKVHQKGRRPGSHLGLPDFIALRQPTPEISLTKNPVDTQTHRQTDRPTVNDISPACLSACRDNNIKNNNNNNNNNNHDKQLVTQYHHRHHRIITNHDSHHTWEIHQARRRSYQQMTVMTQEAPQPADCHDVLSQTGLQTRSTRQASHQQTAAHIHQPFSSVRCIYLCMFVSYD